MCLGSRRSPPLEGGRFLDHEPRERNAKATKASLPASACLASPVTGLPFRVFRGLSCISRSKHSLSRSKPSPLAV